MTGNLWIAGMVVVLLAACGDKKMMTAEEYSKAYGIVAGQPNELRIKGVLFRFPPQYLPDDYASGRNPYPSDKIVKGQAETVTIHMNLETWFNPPPIAHSEKIGLVRIEIRNSGYEDDKNIEDYFKREKWKSVQDRPDLGLREYIRVGNDGAWGYHTYEGLDPKIKTPRGNRFIFNCSGSPGQPPDICSTAYWHPRGPHISYYVSGQLLPRWKEVHAEVIKLIDSLIVQ